MIKGAMKSPKLLPVLWFIGSVGWAVSVQAQSNVVWLRCAWGGSPGGSNIYGIDSANQRVGVFLPNQGISWVPGTHFTATYVQFGQKGVQMITIDRQSLSISVNDVPNGVSDHGRCQKVADPTAGNQF
jgi:hypothetical protein